MSIRKSKKISLMLLIGSVTVSIYSFQVYKMAQGNAINAIEFSRLVRDDIVKVFKAQLPQLVGVNFEIDTFKSSKATACGKSDKNTGAFYCAGDGHIAIPLDFMNSICELGACTSKASLEYVHAPVIAHEACHRIQDVLHLNTKQNTLWHGIESDEWLAESAINEKQCDCLAGVYMASRFSNIALPIGQKLFHALGDDIINPSLPVNKYSHGFGKDRAAAFTRGFNAANVSVCLK